MRNTLTAAAALGLLLGSAACTGQATPATVPSAGPTVAASADRVLSADSKAICDRADRTGKTFGDTFIADLKSQIDARNKGAQAQAQAKQKIARDVSTYSYALADMSELAGDAALKSALKQMSDQVTAFSGNVAKINAEKMSAISDTLDKACGKG